GTTIMNIKEIEKRLKEIGVELKDDKSDVDALQVEFEKLAEQRTTLLAGIEKRNKLTTAVASLGDTSVVESFKEERGADVKPFGPDTKEYRNAWLKNLLGHELTKEERAYVHTTGNTAAVVPVQLQNQIFSDMEES